MKVLITGGAGYIGSWLAHELIKLRYDVVLIDKFHRVSPSHPWLVNNQRSVTVIQADLQTLSENDLEHLHGASWIFHCAGRGKIPQSYVDPVGYHTTNLTGTIAALELARILGIQRFIYPMTSAGFYTPKKIPIDESESIDCPAPYTLTKYLGEQAVLHWAKVYGLGGVSLRLFHVYGPPSPLGVVAYSRVSAALLAKKNNTPFVIDGDGTYTQDLIHVQDVCRAFIKAAQSTVIGEVFHIATGVETSINTLATLIGVQTVTNGAVYKSPYRGVANINKAKKVLKWRPLISLASGISELMQLN